MHSSHHTEGTTNRASACVRLQDAAERGIRLALSAGADHVKVSLHEVDHWLVKVRNYEAVQRSFSQTSGMTLTVYRDGHVGSASTSDTSEVALDRAARAAVELAGITESDPAAGLAESAFLSNAQSDLDLYHPWDISIADAVALARESESVALATDPRIAQIDGASVSSTKARQWLATSDGFSRGTLSSYHVIGCTPVAKTDREKQLGSWSSVARAPEDLDSAALIGRIAAQQALEKLDATQVATRRCPVLFRANAVFALLTDLIVAISGESWYERRSFLQGRLGERIFPRHIQISEDPFVRRGFASAHFDPDGIAGTRRTVVADGQLDGLFLGRYAARRLNMRPTGNGGGPYNVLVESTRTTPADTEAEMLKALGTGLFVTGMSGGGADQMTGHFSRAVHGFWVERGELQFPVCNVTVAGNLADMFAGITAVGADTLTRGALSTGSWLVDTMSIGGK